MWMCFVSFLERWLYLTLLLVDFVPLQTPFCVHTILFVRRGAGAQA